MSTAHTKADADVQPEPVEHRREGVDRLVPGEEGLLDTGPPGRNTTRATMAPSISVEAVATTAERRVRAER